MSSTQEVVFLLAISENPVQSQGLLVVSLTCSRKERTEVTQFQPLPVPPGRSCSPLGIYVSSPEPATLQVLVLGSAWNISRPPFLTLGSRNANSFLGMDSILSVTPKHQFVALSTILELPEGMPSVSWLLPFVSWQLSSCQFSPG